MVPAAGGGSKTTVKQAVIVLLLSLAYLLLSCVLVGFKCPTSWY